MPEGTAPVAPLVEDVLNAAHDVAAAGLEMDSRLDADLHRALLRLVHAVYAHEDALELQHELETEGVREAHVFDVTADRPPTTSYPAHVERILAAAAGVVESVAAPVARVIPPESMTPMDTLMEAVTAYHAHPALAQRWIEAGNRPALVTLDGPHDTVPPPGAPSPAAPSHRGPTPTQAERVLTVGGAEPVAHAVVGRPTASGDRLGVDPEEEQLRAVSRPAVRLRLR